MDGDFMKKPALKLLDGEFVIHRFPPSAKVPAAVGRSRYYWVGKTDEELSIVCEAGVNLLGGRKSRGWSCLKVIGPVDFSATGVLAAISAALATADISIFAISTFDTDYLLVRSRHLDSATAALTEDGYRLTTESADRDGLKFQKKNARWPKDRHGHRRRLDLSPDDLLWK
jgi:hypothetical protein